MNYHLQGGEKPEHVFDFLHLGFFIDRGVGRGLVAENLRHPDRGDAFLEYAFALDDEIVSKFESVHVDVPIHPFCRADDGFFSGGFVRFANRFGVLAGNQSFVEQLFQFRLNFGRIDRREVILHLFPHEHPVRADINDPALGEDAVDQFFDLRIDQWFAAANTDHRSVALRRCLEAFFQRHDVLERRGVFANTTATGARQITGVQRFELQNHRELRGFAQFMFDDVAGDFRRQREGESHRI